MDAQQAVRAIFADQQWVGKLTIVMILGWLTVILMPVFLVGFAPLCILLGYLLDMVVNVREGRAEVLPIWNEVSNRIVRGAGVLVALFVYHLPVVLLGGCIIGIPGMAPGSLTGGLVALMMLCCLTPLMVIYLPYAWGMLAVGTVRYTRVGTASVFFKVAKLYDAMTHVGGYTAQWLFYALLVNICLAVLLLIPCIGWAAAAALAIPLHGHLLGQFARRLDQRELRGAVMQPGRI